MEASFQPEAISHLEAQTLGSIHAPIQNLKLTYDKANTYFKFFILKILHKPQKCTRDVQIQRQV